MDSEGFIPDEVCPTVATYVANAFALGSSAAGAIQIVDDMTGHLKSHWQLDIKPSSREFIVAAGSDPGFTSAYTWKQAEQLNCLGHVLSHGYGANADWEDACSFLV